MKRRIVALALAMAVLISLCAVARAEGELSGTTVVIHTNDVHGAVDGYAKVAAMREIYEAQGAHVLLLDAGGYLEGGYVTASRGEAAVALMNAAGYDLAAVGCDAFAYGRRQLEELEKAADFPMLGANIRRQGEESFAGSHVFAAEDGGKIGVFAVAVPDAAGALSEELLEGTSFLSGDALAACAREQVERLKAKGCETVLCLAHADIAAVTALLESVPGIDVLIAGHAHATLEEIRAATGGTGKVGESVLTSAGEDFSEIGVFLMKDGEVITMNLAAESVVVSDDAVAAAAEEIRQAAGEADSAPQEPAPPVYADVAADAWYADAVAFVTEQGLMNGYDGLFRPGDTLTRAMMVTVLYRMAGSPAVERAVSFTDVAADAWYADAVAWAVEQEITTGVSLTAFAPENAITREQLATFLYRYAGSPFVAGDFGGYDDLGEVGPYALSALAWSNANGYLTGTTATTLSPKDSANRAAVATVLMRYLQNE